MDMDAGRYVRTHNWLKVRSARCVKKMAMNGTYFKCRGCNSSVRRRVEYNKSGFPWRLQEANRQTIGQRVRNSAVSWQNYDRN